MKKVLSVVLAVVLFGSVAALAGCNGHEDLIQGNFSQEATMEQRGEIARQLSAEKQWGDPFEEGWGINVHQVMYGGMYVSSYAGGEGMDIDIDYNNADITLSFRNDGSGYTYWGSGELDFATKMNIMGGSMEMALKGPIYNDMERIYMDIDYSVGISDAGQSYAFADKMKVYDEIGNGDEYGLDFDFSETDVVSSLIDFNVIEAALNDIGVKTYIDDSDAAVRKVKISWSKEGFIEYFEDVIYGQLGSALEIEMASDLLNGLSFGYCDYIFSIDKETERLVGFGSKQKYDLNASLSVSGVTVTTKANVELATWLLLTDAVAEELPADIGGYSDIDMI